MRLLVALSILVISGSAYAEPVVRFTDPAGNLTSTLNREGSRLVTRDPAGNARGYWTKEGDSWAHRSNSGNLLGRAKTPY